jgi:hypothetical protein
MATTSYVFRNPGVLDPISITTFGVSAKIDAATAIGYFGTGLKYAIAVLLRNNCSVTIYSGGHTYTFATQQHLIRNKGFSVVTMNGVELGFTTELGKDWEVWQAFRELYCNMQDEAGECWDTQHDNSSTYDVNHTSVVVTGDAMERCWAKRSSIILEQQAAVHSGADATAYPGPSDYLYYRGVRCYKLQKPSLYTWDITTRMDLTEDRTFKYVWYAQEAAARTVRQADQPDFVRRVVCAEVGTWESNLHYSGAVEATFTKEVTAMVRSFSTDCNHSAMELVRVTALDALSAGEPFRLDLVDQRRLQIAIAFCKKIGFAVDTYPIRCTEFLGDSVLGRASDGAIYISKRTFMMGTKMLVGTLIEEYLHLAHGLQDESRGMQNFLFDALVTLGEKLTKKPL